GDDRRRLGPLRAAPGRGLHVDGGPGPDRDAPPLDQGRQRPPRAPGGRGRAGGRPRPGVRLARGPGRDRHGLYPGHRGGAPRSCRLRASGARRPSASGADPTRRRGGAMTWLRTLVPSPLQSAALLALWLVLARSTSLGQVAWGLLFAVAMPR